MPKPTCRNKALDLLARRPHFRRELAAKLASRGYDDDELTAALDGLADEHLLDDDKTARDFVESRMQREPIGRRRLLADLARHGAPEDSARAAVDAVYPDDDRELAAEAAERWRRRSSGAKAPAALARHLERRGFSRRAIVSILHDAGDAGVADD